MDKIIDSPIADRSPVTRNAVLAVSVGAFAVFLNIAYSSLFNPHRPVEPDATFYLAIAKQLARELVYSDPSNFWPDQPSVGRSPLWPFLTSLGIRAFPSVDPNALIRYCGLFTNVITAMVLTLLGTKVSRNWRIGLLSGVLYALHPTALWDAELGLSEISFLLCAGAGVLLMLDTGRMLSQLFGALLLGVACLARSNFVIFIPLWFGFLCLRKFILKKPLENTLPQLILIALLFYLPNIAWVLRNYSVTGKFPIVSSIRGETFYGAHNALTFYDLSQFGYWVFPDEIPGETPKRTLAQQYNEVELDDYYFQRGVQYVKTHITDLPRLVLGKFIRAYVPVPWVYDWKAWGASLFRIFIWAAALLCIHRWNELSSSRYRDLLWGMIVCNAVMVAVFYGCARFALLIEPFILPFTAAYLLELPVRFRAVLGRRQ